MRRCRLLAAALLLLGGASCRNPFSPSSDAQLKVLYPNGGGVELEVQRSNLTSSSPTFPPMGADFVVRNRVGISLSSVNAVYTDLDGNIVAYAASGGRTFNFVARLDGVTDDAETGLGEGRETLIFPVDVVDRAVAAAVKANNNLNVIIITVTFRGTDDNGYDQKFTGQITLKITG